MDKIRQSIKNLCWFPIETVETAKLARMPALAFSAFGATIWSTITIVGFFSPSKFGHLAILYALLFIVISWGLLRMRREAAIAGLIFSLFGCVFHWGGVQAISNALMVVIDVLAIRGTFAYARLAGDLNSMPSV